jgi:transcriptional regulator GlxA family with amidase domain
MNSETAIRTASADLQPKLERIGNMIDMDFHNYDEMSVEQLATIRDYGLERLQKVTEAMKTRIREEYEQGVSVKRLARSAGVTRRTIYLWVK